MAALIIGADEFAGSQQSLTIDGYLTDWLVGTANCYSYKPNMHKLKVFNDISFIYFGIAYRYARY